MENGLTFGEWLEDQYVAHGLNQTMFAELIHYRQSTVSGWVTGTRPIRSRRACVAIAQTLDVPVDEVFRRARIPRTTRRTGDSAHYSASEIEAVYSRLSPEAQVLFMELMELAARQSDERA